MDIISGLKAGIKAATNPNGNTASMSVKESIKFYYNACIIPLIAAIVVSAIAFLLTGGSFGAAHNQYFSLFEAFSFLGIAAVVVLPALFILVAGPVGIIVDSAIYHFFAARLFKIWPGKFPKTVAAITFGQMPSLLIIWLLMASVIAGSIALYFVSITIIGLWGVIVLIMSLSKQHGISGARAFGGWIASVAVIWVISIIAVVAIVGVLFATGAFNLGAISPPSSECIGTAGFSCSNAALHSGTVSFVLVQNTNSTLYNATLYVSPGFTNTYSHAGSEYVGTIISGQEVAASIPVNVSYANAISEGNFYGSILLNYSNQNGYPLSEYVGTLSAKVS